VSTAAFPFHRSMAVLVVSALLVLGTACSKGQSALCQDAQSLKDALQGLTQVDFQSGGADALQGAVDDVKSAASNLGDEAKTTFGSDVTAIQAQLSVLGGAIDQVKGGASVASVVPAVAASLATLKTSLQDLETTAKDQNCTLT
jgi:hypothetical protein